MQPAITPICGLKCSAPTQLRYLKKKACTTKSQPNRSSTTFLKQATAKMP